MIAKTPSKRPIEADHPHLCRGGFPIGFCCDDRGTVAARKGDAIFDELRRHFDEAQIVELTLRIALCGFFNRFNDALAIEIEDGALTDMLSKGAREADLPGAGDGAADFLARRRSYGERSAGVARSGFCTRG